MDSTDRIILRMLQEDCKTPYKEISEKTGVSESTVHERIKKLKEKGIIKGFYAKIDPKKIGYGTIAWIGLSVEPDQMDEIAEKLTKFDEIQVVATSTGDHDIVIQAVAADDKDLWRFINQEIKTIPGVHKHFHVSTFLDVYKKCHRLQL